MLRICIPSALALLSLITIGCGGMPEPAESQSNEAKQAPMQSAKEPSSQPGDANYGCHPDAGKSGLTVESMSAFTFYKYRAGWCSIGSGAPAGCYSGRYIVFQRLAGSLCVAPVAGSCTDPESTHHVTCDSWVTCLYDCEGNCKPISC